MQKLLEEQGAKERKRPGYRQQNKERTKTSRHTTETKENFRAIK